MHDQRSTLFVFKCEIAIKIHGHDLQNYLYIALEKQWMNPEENGLPEFRYCDRNHVRCKKQYTA